MREFELTKIAMQAEINSQKDVKISAKKTGTGKMFALLKLLKSYDNANDDLYMYVALYGRDVVQIKMDKNDGATYLLSLLLL